MTDARADFEAATREAVKRAEERVLWSGGCYRRIELEPAAE